MRKNTTVYIIVVMSIILAYLYSMHKVIVYNYSGQTVTSIKIDASYTHKEIKNMEDGKEVQVTLFAPFKRRAQMKVTLPNQINSIAFPLEGISPFDNKNQIEIRQEGLFHRPVASKIKF